MEQFDIEKQTKDLQSSALKAIKGLFPVKTKTGTLKLSNIWVDDRLDPGDIQSQLKAKNSDRTWGVPIYGTFELTDEKGKVTQRKDKVRLVTLPKPTPRMSYIINGSEHQISNQLRLRPAGYAVRTGPGGIKGQINLSKGYSGQIEIHMRPETGVMRTKIGQANQRLYPILNALGLSDGEMARRWGQDVLDANKNISQSEYDLAVKSFAKSLLRKDYRDTESAAQDLRKFITGTEMDPKINKRTLGKPHKNMSAEFLADLGAHVLGTVKGEKEPHDRNALEYKEYRKITDLIEERLSLPEFKNKITRKIQYNIAGKDKIEDMIHPAIIGPDIKAVFNLPELHQLPDQLNPIDMWNTATRVTIMGPGGIQSEHQITDDMRDVHPSHLGFLDPVHTPEGSNVGYVHHLPFSVTAKDKTLLTRAINTKTNRLERIDPATFADSVVAFPGQYDRKTEKWKDPKKVVVLAEGNKTRTVSADKVDYTLESPKQSFSVSSNLIPFLETNSGGRTLVASKMAEQAVPLKERERPLVQSRVGGSVTFEDLIGDAFTFRSPVDGIVSKTSADSVVIQGTDGKKRNIQLYNDFPLNSKSFISSDLKVKKGDKVSKDQIISDTNFTKDGSMAIGKNLVTAYMPYKGYNFEDGIVITDAAAKKLTSEHMHLETAQKSDRFDIHKRRFVANYPNVYSKSQVESIDDDGVVKRGTILQPGDPVITRLRKDEIDPENIVLGKLSRTLVRPWKDDSISWHGDTPGKVTDVIRHGNKVKVYVKTEEPASIGDKLVGRYGNKGVVGCFSSDFEILTDRGWVFFKDLLETDKVCTLNKELNSIEYHVPKKIVNEKYNGKMFYYSCRRMEMCCTPNHRHWVRTSRIKKYQFKTSEEIHASGSIHRRGGVRWDGDDVDVFTVPGKNIFPDQHKHFGLNNKYKMDDFLEFFGYWISEGCLGRKSGVHIAQKKSVHPEVYEKISKCLERMGYKVSKGETRLTIYDPRLLSWLWQFGKSKDKFIPRDFLNVSSRQLGILFDAMMDGDGGEYYDNRYKHTRLEYFTISEKLANDVQEIALKLGISANIKPQIRRDKKNTEYVVRLTFKNEIWMNVDKRTAESKWIDYNGTIHCVEVKNNTIYVRKNGIPVFSGNSIIPEGEAPRTKDGTPADIILNPHGIITRINVGQVLENAASKVAEKTGKTYVTDNFTDKNSTEEVKKDLQKHGLSDLEELEDPVTGKSLGKVNVGKTYIMKLKKQVRSQFSARGAGPGWRYSQHTQEPVKGGEAGSKSMDLLTFYSMLAHGSRANLREMASVKGTKNDDFWNALKTGSLLPSPKPTFAYNKFLAYMKGAGVDVKQEGSKLTLAPMTDREIDNLSNGAIKDPQFIRAKDLEEKPGGLMDKKITGGLRGEKWSHIQLNEPIVNPIFEQPVRTLLDMNKGTYNGLMEGRVFVDEEGNYNEEGNGITGGKAIQGLLSRIDKDEKLKEFTEAAKKARSPSALNKANHGIRYVEALKRFKLEPKEAYILNKVPVLPPMFRPIYALPDGNLHTSSVNYLYRDLGLANQKLKFMNSLDYMPESAKQELRRDIYKGTAAIQGLANPITFYPKNRPVRGIIEEIKGVHGAGSKTGFFQKHVLRREQDLVGRGAVIPEPKLGVDELGLPEEMAWTVFRPFVIRDLVNQGYKAVDADKEVDERSFIAKKALEAAMNERPVLLNRAPSLHKFSIMAFKPKIAPGRAVKVPPLIVKGLNMDFDGDQQINSVLIEIPRHLYNFDIGFFESRRCKMTARFRESVGAIDENGIFIICNLQDFPHAEIVKEKDHRRIYSVPPGVRVVALDEKTGKPALADVQYWSVHKDREVEIVELGSGRQIVTDDDERAVYGIDASSLEWCRRRPSEAMAQFVPVLDSIPFDDNAIEEISLPEDNRLKSHARLDESFGYFIGSMIGDGWSSHADGSPKAINIATEYREVLDAWELSLLSVFKSKPIVTKAVTGEGKLGNSDRSTRYTVSCTRLAEFMPPLIGHGAQNKHLPPFTMGAPRQFILGMLGGLWDTDGSMSWSNAKKKPQFMCNFSSTSIRLLQEMQHIFRCLNTKATITPSKTPKGAPFWILNVSSVDFFKLGGIPVHHSKKKAIQNEFLNGTPPNDKLTYNHFRLIPTPSALASELRKIVKTGIDHSLYITLSKAVERQYVSKPSARRVIEIAGDKCKHPLYGKWKQLAMADDFHFEKVKSAKKTYIKETGFDLTVPGYETFMSTDGIVLSNTAHIHVPVMPKAVTEARKMLPSQHLFNPGTGNIMVAPSQEAAIGLYFLTKDGKSIKKSFNAVGSLQKALDSKEIDISDMVTLAGKKTSAGRAMVDAVLPEKYQGRNQVLDKKGVSSLLAEIAQNDPNDYAKTVHALAELGNEYAYNRGFTVGIDDIQPDLPEKDVLFAEARKRAKSLDDAGIIKLYSDVDKQAKKIIAKRLGEQENNLYQMVRSGARGNMDQLKQIVSAPLLFEDVHGDPLPIPVESSFSKGLSMSEYWNSMYGARKGSVDAKLQTAKPGEFNKDLMSTTVKNVIAEEDCGTDRGVDFDIGDVDAQDRILTSDIKIGASTVAKAGDIITSNMASKLRLGGVKKIKARSPLTCNLPKGTCSKCYGLDTDGRFHAIGDNLGAIAGQSLTEPLTQMVLRAKHHGGVAGGTQLSGYEKIDKLIHMPKTIVGKATLAERSGKISNIEDSPAGGKNVFIDDVKHFVSPQNSVKVRLGAKLKKGDPLSDGIIHPRDLVRLKGMESAQGYLVDEIANAYRDTGVNLKRKNIEAVIRSVADTTKVLDGGDSPWLYGDTVSYNEAEAFNRSALGKMPLSQAEGKPLYRDHGPVKAGTTVGKKVSKILEGLGYNEVSVGPDPIVHQPFLDGIKQLPMLSKDWMAQMGYGHLVRGIKEGAGQAWETDIHDYSPIPAFAYGAEFGMGQKGKY